MELSGKLLRCKDGEEFLKSYFLLGYLAEHFLVSTLVAHWFTVLVEGALEMPFEWPWENYLFSPEPMSSSIKWGW